MEAPDGAETTRVRVSPDAPSSPISPRVERTLYFTLDDGTSSFDVAGAKAAARAALEPRAASDSVVEEAWVRERQELEWSAVRHKETVHRELQVEQRVSSLLGRLDQLSSGERLGADDQHRVPLQTPPPPHEEEKAAEEFLAKLRHRQAIVEGKVPVIPAVGFDVQSGLPSRSPSSPSARDEAVMGLARAGLDVSTARRTGAAPTGLESHMDGSEDVYDDELHQADARSAAAAAAAVTEAAADGQVLQAVGIAGSRAGTTTQQHQRRPLQEPQEQHQTNRVRAEEDLEAQRQLLELSLAEMGQSRDDRALLVAGGAAGGADLWHGWTMETTRDGKLFYHHAASATSQWQVPSDLKHLLGEWRTVAGGDAYGEEVAADGGGGHWWNDVLGVRSPADPTRTTNIFQAALEGNFFFLQLYTEVGGFVDAKDIKGRTALHYNCAAGAVQAVLYLLQHGASANVVEQTQSTPLHYACRYGHADSVQLLLDAKATVDRQNVLGDTPMHEAAALGSVATLYRLVAAGADPCLRNRESRTPAEVAKRCQGSLEAATLLARNERRWKRQRGFESDGSSDSDAARPRPRASSDHSASDTSSEEIPEPSLALLIVRAAKPLLRGVEWVAGRVLRQSTVAEMLTRSGARDSGGTVDSALSEDDDSASSVSD